MTSSRWPTPLKKLRTRFPDSDIVQMRITHPKGASISFDGVATAAIKAALFGMIAGGHGVAREKDVVDNHARVVTFDEEPPAAQAAEFECSVCGATETSANLGFSRPLGVSCGSVMAIVGMIGARVAAELRQEREAEDHEA